jgi:hypothetical protein
VCYLSARCEGPAPKEKKKKKKKEREIRVGMVVDIIGSLPRYLRHARLGMVDTITIEIVQCGVSFLYDTGH